MRPWTRRAAVVLGLLAILGLPSRFEAQPREARREVRVGLAGLPTALDPAATLEGPGLIVARQVFDTLVAHREGSTDIEPALAVRWTVSRDGLTWSFTLREGVRFHDGTPLTAAEVVASLERQARPEGGAAAVWSALLRGVPGVVKEVRATDARTVSLVLIQPYAPVLAALAHPGFSITRTVTGAEGAPILVGTGPFRVVEAAPGRLALEAVAGHFAGTPRSPRLVFLEIGSDEQAEAEFDARTLDLWFPAAPPRRQEWAQSTPGLQVAYLVFQTEKEPFGRRALRRAVASALDPAQLAAALDRVAVPLQSFLPPGVWGRREGSPLLGGTREAVKRLVVESGWSGPLAPVLAYPADAADPVPGRLAGAIQASLAAAGLSLQLRPEPAGALRGLLQGGEHELALAEATVLAGDPHLFLYPLSATEGAVRGPLASNFSFHRDRRLDDMLVRASQLGFRSERVRLYARVQATLAEELPWLPLSARLLWVVVRPDVRGFRLHPTGAHRLTGVTLEAGRGP